MNEIVMLLGVLVASAIAVWLVPTAATPSHRRRWTYRCALGLLLLYALFWAAVGFGERAAGIRGGEMHLLPAAAAAFPVFIGWYRPGAAVIVLLLEFVLGTVQGISVLQTGWRPPEPGMVPLSFVILDGPFLLAAILLKVATGGGATGQTGERPV